MLVRELPLITPAQRASRAVPIQAAIRSPRRGGQFAGDVRFSDLRLLRRGHRRHLLSQPEPVRVADALVGHLRRGISDAATGRHRAGRLHRSSRPPRRAAADAEPDGHRNFVHRRAPRLRGDRAGRAVAGAGRPAAPGPFRGRGTRRRVRLSCRNRDAGAQGFLRQLAIRQPAGRGDVCRAAGHRAGHEPVARPDGQLGVARASAGGLHADPRPVVPAQLARGDRGVPRPPAPPQHAPRLSALCSGIGRWCCWA